MNKKNHFIFNFFLDNNNNNKDGIKSANLKITRNSFIKLIFYFAKD